MSKQLPFGAALQYAIDTLGGPLFEQDTFVTTGSGNPGVVAVDANGDRVGLIISNFGANDVLLARTAFAAGTSGIRLTLQGGFFQCDVTRDFTLPAQRWYATGTTGATTLYIVELIRYNKAYQQ